MAKSMEAKFRARIARIAKGEVGQKACSRRKTNGKPGYFTSCHGGAKEPEFWCSDFVRWVWWKAGAVKAAPGTKTPLNAAAGRFVLYGKLRRRPRVGDAVLFGYNKDIHDPVANHVAVVVKVNPNGTIRSVSGDLNGEAGSDEHFAKTSRVVHDKPYTSAIDSFGPNAPNGPVSGYVSPVEEDDMPYTKKQIIGFVKEGVSEELNTKLKNSNVTPARGAKAAVDAQKALKDLQDQVAVLTKYVKEHLPPSSVGPANTTGNGPATTTGDGPATTTGTGRTSTTGTGRTSGSGTGRTSSSGTGGRRTGARTRTSPTT